MDIAPEIYEQIKKDFAEGIRSDAELNRLAKKIKAGKGTQRDVSDLADRFGVQASKALKANLILEQMPDQTLYWNIAEKTIKPLLMQSYKNINGFATVQLESADKKGNISIEIIPGRYPENRIDQVMNFAVDSKTQTELDNALTDPVIAANRKFYDDFQKDNAELREDLGFWEYVQRDYDDRGLHFGTKYHTDCEWCLEKAGTWKYSEARAAGVFQRHPGCNCHIEVYTDKQGGRVTNRQIDWHHNEWELQ